MLPFSQWKTSECYKHLKHGLPHPSRSYMASGHCRIVLFIEMCSESQPQHLQVLIILWEGGTHRDSLRNTLCCFVFLLYESIYETEFSTSPVTLPGRTPRKLCRSWWFTPPIPAPGRQRQENSGFLVLPRLYCRFETSLGCMRSCLRKQTSCSCSP